MARTTGPEGRSVVSKLFATLDVFSDGPARLTLTQIARRTGLPTSTTARLLHALTQEGWLERRAVDGSYQIGMRLWELGALAPRKRDLRDAAIPYLQDLYEAVHQNVQLAVLDEGEALCIERVYGKHAVDNETDAGGRLPLHATATGKALLAHAPEGVLARVLAGPLMQHTPSTLTDPTALRQELSRIRTTGIAISREERTEGVVAIASPIRSVHRGLVGAVGIVAPAGVSVDRLGPAVRTVALAIARSSSSSAGED